jgi:hypothetical protein
MVDGAREQLRCSFQGRHGECGWTSDWYAETDEAAAASALAAYHAHYLGSHVPGPIVTTIQPTVGAVDAQ